MIIHGVKPRTQLTVDALLFGLLSLVTLSALMEHAGTSPAHTRFEWHMLHGIAGTGMCLTLSIHLLMHLPWIKSQVAQLFGNRKDAGARPR